MQQQKGSTALVTGASSGIGLAYSQHLAKEGWELHLVSQKPAKAEIALKSLHPGSARYHYADLSDPGSVENLNQAIPTPDLIIANAGVTRTGAAGSIDIETRRQMSYLLCNGVIDLIEYHLPVMMQRGSGRIVIISSIGAITPMPKSSIYASAKAGIYAYGRSINEELREKNISITVSLPGYVRTDAHKRAGLGHLETQIPSWMWISAEQVVQETESASLKNKSLVIPGAIYRLVRPFLGSRAASAAWRLLNRRKSL
ncbi:MAG: hypothetical protein CMQ40_11795 [Gammaproteobacteria bacterium]|nr:hypothetical protein [Gammaproteobacteria bacterium]